jgi:hypothetical protein
MFVELVLTLWGKPRLGLQKREGRVIKRAERDEPPGLEFALEASLFRGRLPRV